MSRITPWLCGLFMLSFAAGCQGLSPTPSPIPSPTSVFSALAAAYDCWGADYIGGPYAGAGTLTINADGSFEYHDYYPAPAISGHLEQVNPDELRVVEELALLSITVNADAGLRVNVREDAGVTHGVAGYIDCFPRP